VSAQPLKLWIALKDALNGWKALHLCAALLFSVDITALQLHFHITEVHSFPDTEQQHHRPTTPNALEFPPGSLPINHSDVSQAVLTHEMNFPSPSVRAAQEISNMYRVSVA